MDGSETIPPYQMDASDWITLLVLAVPVVAVIVWLLIGQAKRARQSQANLAEVTRLQAKYKDYKLYVSPIDLTFIGINLDLASFVLGSASRERVYTFDQFIDAKVLQDASDETRTSGYNYQGGSYTATSRTYYIVSKLDLKITVSDTETPVQVVNFYQANGAVWQDLDAQIDLVNKVVGYLNAILHDRRQALAAAAKDDDAVDDTADELQKLWDLCQAGALTTEEFETMKAKLLRKKR